MTTSNFGWFIAILGMLFLVPFVVYLSVTLGTYAFLTACKRFKQKESDNGE